MSHQMDKLKSCPDCGVPPVVRTRKTVHGIDSGILIECQNEKCPGISHGVNRYAYSGMEWNAKHPRRPLPTRT